MTRDVQMGPAVPVVIAGSDPTGITTPIEVTSTPSNPVVVEDSWAFGIQSATTVNQQQSFTVPTGKIWHIFGLYIQLATTATPGNRQVEVLVIDNLGVEIASIRVGTTQAATLTYKYMLAPGLADLTSIRDSDYLMTPIPPTWVLPAGFIVRVRDNNAVDAAADDFQVQMHYAERTA